MRKLVTTLSALLIVTSSFACFIMFLTDGKNILVANHEDWYARDAEITFVPAAGKKFGMLYFDFASEGTAQGGMNTEGFFLMAPERRMRLMKTTKIKKIANATYGLKF
ncbi:MAG: hypothetical protein ABI691_25175 [Ginsengibacter sp.]